MSDREGYLKRRDQLLMQDEEIAELERLGKESYKTGFIDGQMGAEIGLAGLVSELKAELAALREAVEKIKVAERIARETHGTPANLGRAIDEAASLLPTPPDTGEE